MEYTADSERSDSMNQTTIPYAELHVISNYSFLRGASHPQELVKQAAALNYQAIAITDECSFCGIVKAHVTAKEQGIKLLIGSEFFIDDKQLPEAPLHLVILVKTKAGYHQLSSLITLTRRRSEKGQYQISLADLEHILSDCLFIWLPHPDINLSLAQGSKLKKRLEQNLWIGFNNSQSADHQRQYFDCYALGEQLNLPLVACNNVHMHEAERKPLLDILQATRKNTTVYAIAAQLAQNAEGRLRSLPELSKLYPRTLLDETRVIADQCQFSLDDIVYEYPAEIVPQHLSPSQYLRQLCVQGLAERWPEGAKKSVKDLLEMELKLIEEMAYEYYFLTVHDLCVFAKSQNIYYQGRGSAANSVVCYCLFITEVSPDKIDMLFERFISKERNEPPDIDVDFEHQRREEVIQYIYKKYTRERAALAASVVTYKPKSAIRDVGKALGMNQGIIENLVKSLSWWDRKKELIQRFQEKQVAIDNRVVEAFMDNLQIILGFPRHLSQHVGGFIITQSPISTLVPVENAAMPERTVIQWDKYDIEALGLLKVDVLALGMLTMIHKAIDLINSYQQEKILFSDIPPDDSATYDLLCQADTVGIFQVESRAQMTMLPRLKPRTFYDLVIEVAIVRPGPIQGKMVHPYLKRRSGLEQPTYPNDAIKSVLHKTLGVPIFQEQVIKLAMVAANFTGGEADQLRRSMASWGRNGHLEFFEKKLIDGMLKNGYSLAFAKQLYEQIKGFSGYGFPESHSASFALLVYVSAWLKRHHPQAFYCALLNSQPMGFYTPSQLLQDASQHGIRILPITWQHSQWESTLEREAAHENKQRPLSIRLGLHLVNGLSESGAKRLVAARQKASIANAQDIKRLAKLNQKDFQALIHADALKATFGERKQVHWQAQRIEPEADLLSSPNRKRRSPFIVRETRAESMIADYESTKLCLHTHPLMLLRQQAPFNRCRQAAALPETRHKQLVRVAGLVTCRQSPTSASGVIFLTLEDESGNINVVVWNSLFQRFRQALMSGKLLFIKGHVEREDSVIHVIAGYIEDHSHLLAFKTPSRDFH